MDRGGVGRRGEGKLAQSLHRRKYKVHTHTPHGRFICILPARTAEMGRTSAAGTLATPEDPGTCGMQVARGGEGEVSMCVVEMPAQAPHRKHVFLEHTHVPSLHLGEESPHHVLLLLSLRGIVEVCGRSGRRGVCGEG